MSNSIWKTSDEIPEDKTIVIYESRRLTNIGTTSYYVSSTRFGIHFDEYVKRWCYLDELLAQADKAERLQKAVDLLIDSLERVQNKCRKAKMTEINYGKIDGIEAVATEAIKEIKQLIKETTNDK